MATAFATHLSAGTKGGARSLSLSLSRIAAQSMNWSQPGAQRKLVVLFVPPRLSPALRRFNSLRYNRQGLRRRRLREFARLSPNPEARTWTLPAQRRPAECQAEGGAKTQGGSKQC